jgi:hypothetical protein
METAGIAPTLRGEQLTVDDFVAIARARVHRGPKRVD